MSEFAREQFPKKIVAPARLVWDERKGDAPQPSSEWSGPPEPLNAPTAQNNTAHEAQLAELKANLPAIQAAPPATTAPIEPAQAEVQSPPGEEESEVPKSKEGRRKKSKRDSKEKQVKLLQELDTQGSAEQYVMTFDRHPEFDYVAHQLDNAIALKATGKENFTLWELMAENKDRAPDLVNYFSKILPHGPGRDAFLDGLKNPNKKSQEYLSSKKALLGIVGILGKHMEETRSTRENLATTQKTSAFGETVDKIATSAREGWDRQSTVGGKAVFIGATLALIGAAIYIGKKRFPFADDKGDKSLKVWHVLGAGGLGFLLLNEGVGIYSGKRLTDHIGLGRKIDNLPDGDIMKSFINSFKKKGATEEEEKKALSENTRFFETVTALHATPMRELFEYYESANRPDTTTKREIDPKKLGFYNSQIDGKLAYEAVEAIVLQAAGNQWAREYEATNPGKKVSPERLAKIVEDFKNNSGQVEARGLFLKYLNGFKYPPPTLFDIIIYNNGFRAKEASDRRKEAKDIRESSVAGATIALGGTALNAIGRAASATFDATKEYVWEPGTELMEAALNRYTPKAAKALKKVAGKGMESGYNRALPDRFSIAFSNGKTGRINDFPVSATNVGPDGPKGILIGATTNVGGKSFDLDLTAGVDDPKNIASATAIEKHIESEMQILVDKKSQTVTEIKGKKPVWDVASNSWLIKGLNITGGADGTALGLDAGARGIRIRPNDDGTDIEFIYKDEALSISEGIDKAFAVEVVKDQIKLALPTMLKESEIKITKISAHATRGGLIEGTIAGVPFNAIPLNKDIDGGIEFYDATDDSTGLDKVVIKDDKNGEALAKDAVAHVIKEKDFQETYAKAEQLIRETGEFTAKWEYFKTISVDGLSNGTFDPTKPINGPILQKWWKNILDLKRLETLRNVERDILYGTNGKQTTLADIKKIHNSRVGVIVDKRSPLGALNDLVKSIESADDTQRAKNFDLYLIENSGGPRGLELINYSNPDFRVEHITFRKMLDTFKFEGIESIDALSKGNYKLRQEIMMVWSELTAPYSNKIGSLTPDEITKIRQYITVINDKLTKAKVDGVVKRDGGINPLPKFDINDIGLSAAKWID